MALCGIPIFVLEVAVGQYLGEGGMTLVGRLCPLLGGTGMATMVLVSLLNIYYCVIVGWAIFYLIVSLATLPSLPWDTCGQTYIHHDFSNKTFLWKVLIVIFPLQTVGGTLRNVSTSTRVSM